MNGSAAVIGNEAGMSLDPRDIGLKAARHGRSLAQGFAQFLLRGRVVDLAVAVVIGAAAGNVITSFVKGVFTPLIAAIFGKPDFERSAIVVNGTLITYGSFLDALITFLIVAVVIYFFVIAPTNRLVTNAYFEAPPDPAMRKCPECQADIPKTARRCMYCTQPVYDAATAASEENVNSPRRES
jgi:large conductance mechanosensitive channel